MIKYSGITHSHSVRTLDDGTFLVTVNQEKVLDPVLKKTETETVVETADRNELFAILAQCYPEEN